MGVPPPIMWCGSCQEIDVQATASILWTFNNSLQGVRRALGRLPLPEAGLRLFLGHLFG